MLVLNMFYTCVQDYIITALYH